MKDKCWHIKADFRELKVWPRNILLYFLMITANFITERVTTRDTAQSKYSARLQSELFVVLGSGFLSLSLMARWLDTADGNINKNCDSGQLFIMDNQREMAGHRPRMSRTEVLAVASQFSARHWEDNLQSRTTSHRQITRSTIFLHHFWRADWAADVLKMMMILWTRWYW